MVTGRAARGGNPLNRPPPPPPARYQRARGGGGGGGARPTGSATVARHGDRRRARDVTSKSRSRGNTFCPGCRVLRTRAVNVFSIRFLLRASPSP